LQTLRALTLFAVRSYCTVSIIGEAAGVAAGLVVMATVVLPVTVRASVPLEDAKVVESPRYCALMECVPTARVAGAVRLAVPLETATAVPIMVPLSSSCTLPVGVPPVTEAVKVNAVPEATLPFVPLVRVNFVLVDTFCAGGALLTPLQPSVKASRQTSPRPSAAWSRLRPPGRKMRKMAAKPAPALRDNQPLAEAASRIGLLPFVAAGGMAFASKIRSSRRLNAESVVEVASTWQFNVPVTAEAPVTLMAKGEFGQVTPGGREAAVAVTVTVPVKPLLGVTVMVEPAAAPVDELSVTGVEDKVKDGADDDVTLNAALVAPVKPVAAAASV
jgi:hypothetical protein